MKYSKQRQLILDIVKDSCDHPTAQTIYYRAKEKMPNISLGTVYRNLISLYENGDIKHIQIANKKDRYDGNICTHFHIYCEECKKTKDIPLEILESSVDIIEKKYNFKVSKDLVLIGVCNECMEREK